MVCVVAEIDRKLSKLFLIEPLQLVSASQDQRCLALRFRRQGNDPVALVPGSGRGCPCEGFSLFANGRDPRPRSYTRVAALLATLKRLYHK